MAAWRGITECDSFRTAGTRLWDSLPIFIWLLPSPNTDLVEYLTGSPFIDEIVAGGWKLDGNGMLAIPGGPGLGIEINVDALAEYSLTSDADPQALKMSSP